MLDVAAGSSAHTHRFSARVERIERGGPFYAVTIPVSVSKAIGKRGNVPVIAEVNGAAEVRASLLPCGGGRHRLRLNAEARRLANADEGDRVAVALTVDENPVADATPADLLRALREADALAAFERLPVGKRNHIVHWIEEAVMEATRERRIALAVEVALRKREKDHDRALLADQKRRR